MVLVHSVIPFLEVGVGQKLFVGSCRDAPGFVQRVNAQVDVNRRILGTTSVQLKERKNGAVVRKRGDQHQGAVHVFPYFFQIRLGAFNQEFAEVRAPVSHDGHGVGDVEDDERFVDIHLQVSSGTTESDGYIVRHDLHCDHGQRLGLCRVHFARHDGRTRFVCRNYQFGETARGPHDISRMSFAIL